MDWLVIFATISVLSPLVFLTKKHLTLSELYTTVVFGLFVQTLVDTFASFEYKAWGFYEVEAAELKTLWIIIAIYPFFSSLIINWYPYQKAWWKKVLHLFAWAIFSTAYEWLTMQVGIMWHIHWELVYSLFLYPAIYYLLIIHVRWYRWLHQEQRT